MYKRKNGRLTEIQERYAMSDRRNFFNFSEELSVFPFNKNFYSFYYTVVARAYVFMCYSTQINLGNFFFLILRDFKLPPLMHPTGYLCVEHIFRVGMRIMPFHQPALPL